MPESLPGTSRFVRFKRFPGRSSVVWVLSIGRHEGRRLNLSFHRVPKARAFRDSGELLQYDED